MNFREAMRQVMAGETVRVTPDTTGGNPPYLIKVGFLPDSDQDCLQCVCLTEDGKRIEPGETWEPVCYLLCFDEYLDGEWEVVDTDDFANEHEEVE